MLRRLSVLETHNGLQVPRCYVHHSLFDSQWDIYATDSRTSCDAHYTLHRHLQAENRLRLATIATLFLTGIYRRRDALIPVTRAKMVYLCAVAMTFLYQPTEDSRMLQEFRTYIGDFRQSLGIDDSYDWSQCQLLVMQYFNFVYHC